MKTRLMATVTLSVFGFGWSAPVQAQSWELAATLTPDGEPVTRFGTSVACSGDTLVVGSPDETNGEERAGVAYVYSGDDFARVARLTPSDSDKYDQLGDYVDIDGDTLLMGNGKLDRGSVRAYSRASGTWTEVQTLEPPDGITTGSWGRHVRISGDRAMVGAPKQDGDTGTVYLFSRADPQWGHGEALHASDAQTADFFGYALDLDGATAVASAPGNAFSRTERAGVYVFEHSGTGWAQTQRLSIEGEPVSPPDVYYGVSVSLHANTIAVGATAGADNPTQGRVDVYVRGGGAFVHEQSLTLPEVDRYGAPVLVRGDTLWVGARSIEGVPLVVVYERASGAWSESQRIEVTEAAGEYSSIRSLAACGGTLVLGASSDSSEPSVAMVWRNPALDVPDATGGADGGVDSGTSGGDASSDGMATDAGSSSSGGCTAVPGGATTGLPWLAALLLLLARSHGSFRRRRGREGLRRVAAVGPRLDWTKATRTER